MKKGFTLIELLAVIVILAIISVIAVPTLIGVVNKAKLGALKSSAYGLIEAGTLYNAQYANSNNARFDILNNVITTTEENKIKYRGSVKQGTVIVSTKGKVSVCVTDGKNSAYKNYNDTEVTLVSKKTCSVPANTSIVYLDGEATIDSVDAKNILDRLDRLEEMNKNKNVTPLLDYSNPLFSFDSSHLTYTVVERCYLFGQMPVVSSGEPKLYINDTLIGVSGTNGGNFVPVISLSPGDVVKVNQWTSPFKTLNIFAEKNN